MSSTTHPTRKDIIAAVVAFVVFVAFCIGGVAGCREFSRYQKRADAVNKTKIVRQEIKTAEQQALVNRAQIAATQAEAEKRIVEAEGIRKAQDLISATLTPLYVQHEAIKAQENDRQGDRTYIPVGPQGVPIVADVASDRVGP